jgi:hypothetical protein
VKLTIRLALIVAVASLVCINSYAVFAQAAPVQTAPVQTSFLRLNHYGGWGTGGQGALITCLAQDFHGHIWVGTEDTGVWSNNPIIPGGRTWVNYAATTGLADKTCTALLADSMGRVWAGTLNHGVSVFNGRIWQNYDDTAGPLGNHVTAIAENPIDHVIWIATENGISKYDQASGKWTYVTKADGLPSNQPSVISFDKTGTVYVGTDCDGIGVATAAGNYNDWRTVPGPFRPTHAGAGTGLPSEVINAISVGPSVIYVGTDWGLAETNDSGKTWHYIRGVDWKAIAKGEYPPTTDKLTDPLSAFMLSDRVTCLAQDGSGNLWVGHRDFGAEVFDTSTFKRTGQTSTSNGDFITALLPTPIGLIFGTYGSGVSILTGDTTNFPQTTPAPVGIASLPVPAAPPTTAELAQMEQRIAKAAQKIKPGDAYYLGEDWDTQGNWLSHYGNQWALLCESWNGNETNFFVDQRISSGSFMGPTAHSDKGLRSWVADSDPKDRRGLYDPLNGKRAVTNWNDNGEVFPMTDGGGDLWYTITIPEGVYRLSSYFYNNDGDDGNNRSRDYLLEVRPHVSDHNNVTTTDAPLACTRVVHFRGAVYKSFILCGPASYDVRINRNVCFNGIFSGYFVDKLSGPADPSDTAKAPWLHGVDYSSPAIGKGAANSLWKALDQGYSNPDIYALEQPYRLLAYRAEKSSTTSTTDSLEAMRWQTHIWTTQDNLKFQILTDKALQNAK